MEKRSPRFPFLVLAFTTCVEVYGPREQVPPWPNVRMSVQTFSNVDTEILILARTMLRAFGRTRLWCRDTLNY